MVTFTVITTGILLAMIGWTLYRLGFYAGMLHCQKEIYKSMEDE